MMKKHLEDFLTFLQIGDEDRNIHLVRPFFEKAWGKKVVAFNVHSQCAWADGLVDGRFALEVKGKRSSWLSGLIQGIAYQTRKELTFSMVVVVAKDFLAAWNIKDIPNDIQKAIALHKESSPRKIGDAIARDLASREQEILDKAFWNLDTFTARPSSLKGEEKALLERHFAFVCDSFVDTVNGVNGGRVLLSPNNFTSVVGFLKPYFYEPIKAVRAFYLALDSWEKEDYSASVSRKDDQISFGGNAIDGVISHKRESLCAFLQTFSLKNDIDFDKFYQFYDKAIDEVDKDFRRKHGVYFTDLDLSRFCMWLAREAVGDFSKEYMVIDPACGSGNLAASWNAPLDLRHKILSELEPEMLFAVNQRFHKDKYHKDRYTIVPDVDGGFLNFLDTSAAEYVAHINKELKKRKLDVDKPIAFLCNPPYRGEDDQKASAVSYEVHQDIRELLGEDLAKEHYACFLAQMKMICEKAKETGRKGDNLILIFTKSAWLTHRPTFIHFRDSMRASFDFVDGGLFDAKEFFDVSARWPVMFSIWRQRPKNVSRSNEPILLKDFTSVKKEDLEQINWSDLKKADEQCKRIMDTKCEFMLDIGREKQRMLDWIKTKRYDFGRTRPKEEREALKNIDRDDIEARRAYVSTIYPFGGLPRGTKQETNNRAYGHHDGTAIGFMDDLCPVRVKGTKTNRFSHNGEPWFRLNPTFMDVKRNYLLSGPPDKFAYRVSNILEARKAFQWYAIAKAIERRVNLPLAFDALELYPPDIPPKLTDEITAISFAIGYSNNSCIECIFPAGDPVPGLSELICPNPMSGLEEHSFWNQNLRLHALKSKQAKLIIDATDAVFEAWKRELGRQGQVHFDTEQPYFTPSLHRTRRVLTLGAGLRQIRDYATATENRNILMILESQSDMLTKVLNHFYAILDQQFDYFAMVPMKTEKRAA